MSNVIDKAMWFLYSSSISLLDVFVVIILSSLGAWYWLLMLPWFLYSSKQKQKYD
jgi:hypothetical protein